ncbi:MAG: hypothetical protein ACR2RE_04060, partial [Geminicoccaceae bacterium]
GSYMSAKAWLALDERQVAESARDERQGLEPARDESDDPLRRIVEKSKKIKASMDAAPIKPRRISWHDRLAYFLRRAIPNNLQQGNV